MNFYFVLNVTFQIAADERPSGYETNSESEVDEGKGDFLFFTSVFLS